MSKLNIHNKQAYEAYEFVKKECESHPCSCEFCPYLVDEGAKRFCAFGQKNCESFPDRWPKAIYECDTCHAKDICNELNDDRDKLIFNLEQQLSDLRNEVAMWKEVVVEKNKLINQIKEALNND